MYSKTLSLRFPKDIVNDPIVVKLVKDYDLSFNLLKTVIYPRKEGLMVLQLSGHRENFKEGVRYLKKIGVKVESIGDDIRRNEQTCIHCGACTAVCPTGALHIKRPEMEVLFDREKCSACEWCVPLCPVHAMEVKFNKVLLD